jgi:ATP-dependent Lon protease
MTGELSLTGVVLPVGGIKEKVLGAKRAGIREVILPAENEPNVTEDLQGHMLEGVEIHYVSTVDQALEFALSKPVPAAVGLKTEQIPPVAPAPAGVPPIH